MSIAPRRHQSHLFPRARLGLMFASILALAGCETPSLHNVVLGPDYQPSNVFRSSESLPNDLRRVAVLPLTSGGEAVEAVAGPQCLEPVLRTELLKLRRFDLIWVSPESLRQWTGRKSWQADDKLPQTFFSTLRDQLACDGVLFCHVSRFHSYPPLVVGWNLKLVEANRAQTLWAVDEVFDTGEPLVSNSARRYEQHHQKGSLVTDTPAVLNSPERFGHYTAWAVLSTMPERPNLAAASNTSSSFPQPSR